jgi:hypothetical protein
MLREQFKVWVHVEHILVDKLGYEEHYEDVGEPDELGCFDTQEAAEDFAARLQSVDKEQP